MSSGTASSIRAPTPALRKRPNQESPTTLVPDPTRRFSNTRPIKPFHTSSHRPVQRRSFLQRYLMEVFIFTCTLSGSLLYMYLNLEAEHQDLEARLPARQKFRTWDWPPLHEMQSVQTQWHLAVVSLILPRESDSDTDKQTFEDVTFQSSMGHEHRIGPEDPGHITMPSFFLDHDVYGIVAWHPADHSIKNITKYNKQAHLDLKKDLQNAYPLPDMLYEMDVENRNRGLELGWTATFSNMRSKLERDEIESQMLLLGRMYGQVAIYKWWSHQYGPDPRNDVSIIQEILPTAAATWNMRTSGPVYRVRYEHRLKPYQVPGEYHHAPRQKLPQYENTKKYRRKKHIEWVKQEVIRNQIRKEENEKLKETRRQQKLEEQELNKQEEKQGGNL
jgi:hypothetical protein